MNDNKNLKEAVYQNYFTNKVQKNYPFLNQDQFFKWSKLMYKRISKWLPENKDSKILDLGTGIGNFLIMMDSLGYKNLTGVDISGEQINIVKKFLPQIKLIKQNIIEYLENNNEKFDLISLIDVIEHFKKDDAFYMLKHIKEALNKNGRIIIQTPNAVSPWVGMVSYGDLTHEWFYTPNSLDDLFIQCDLERTEFIEITPMSAGIKGFIRYCLWKILEFFYIVINYIEIGSSARNQIYSRVFLATAVKKD